MQNHTTLVVRLRWWIRSFVSSKKCDPIRQRLSSIVMSLRHLHTESTTLIDPYEGNWWGRAPHNSQNCFCVQFLKLLHSGFQTLVCSRRLHLKKLHCERWLFGNNGNESSEHVVAEKSGYFFFVLASSYNNQLRLCISSRIASFEMAVSSSESSVFACVEISFHV